MNKLKEKIKQIKAKYYIKKINDSCRLIYQALKRNEKIIDKITKKGSGVLFNDIKQNDFDFSKKHLKETLKRVDKLSGKKNAEFYEKILSNGPAYYMFLLTTNEKSVLNNKYKYRSL